MKRAILATLGLAVAMVLGVTLMTTGTARASDPDNNDVITIASPQNGTAVAVVSGGNIDAALLAELLV